MSKRQATRRGGGKERKRQRVNVDGSGPQGLVVTALALSREGRMPVSVAETVFGSRATVGLPGYVSVDEERGELVLEKERSERDAPETGRGWTGAVAGRGG